MSPDRTDLDWVAARLRDVSAPETAATDRARTALMEHVAAAAPITPAESASHSRRPPRRIRRSLTLSLAAGAVATAAFGIVNVISGGHAGSLPEASAAQIVAHARRALDVPPGQVLAYTITDANGTATQTAENDMSPQDWALRPTSKGGQPGFEEGQEDGMREFYDRATNTIYRDSDTSKVVGLAPGDDALLDEMNAPGAKTTVHRDATLGSRPATEITSTEPDGTVYQLWVAGDNNDRPLRFTWTPPSAPVQTTTWSDYETVTPSARTPSPAKLTNAHPSATVTKLNDAAYSAQQSKVENGN